MEYLFYLKKIIAFFVEPLGLVLLFMFFSWFFWMRHSLGKAKFFTTLAFLSLLLFSYPPFSNYLVENLEKYYPTFEKAEKRFTYIHVLGSGHNDDQSQPLSSQIGSDGMRRVIEGVLIHKRYPTSKLIFTGYEGTTSVATAKINGDLARALGVNQKHIIINIKPKDTHEEALFAKKFIGKRPFILVTSASHMPRAMRLFAALDLHPQAAPTAFKRKDAPWMSAPSINAFENSQLAVHEYIGTLWQRFME
ncbi:MAG: YdcF family protein [Thiovulaceae bacterium]|nr:YdcF family protein [Sulfurimonadaceae bacterium]